MNVHLHLVGFGHRRPPGFDRDNNLGLRLERPVNLRQLMQQAGFADPSGFILVRGDTVIAEHLWDETRVGDGDRITVMSAIEGG